MSNAEVLDAQIESLRAMLQPDGYDLVVKAVDGDAADLEVVAGPDACADCLVPQPVFIQIIDLHLADAGVHVRDLIYPDESAAPH